MTKKEFLSRLRRELCRLDRKELLERIGFYSEIIDDKIEEGLSEEDAVADVGSVDDIAEQILSEIGVIDSLPQSKKTSKGQIVLLIVGSPIWLPLLIAALVVMWSVVIALWAVEIPFLIISFISKLLIIACVESSKLVAKISKIFVVGIIGIFRS